MGNSFIPEDVKATAEIIFNLALADMKAGIIFRPGPNPDSWEYGIVGGEIYVIHDTCRGWNIAWEACKKGQANIAEFSAEGQKVPHDSIRQSIHYTCADKVRNCPQFVSLLKSLVVKKAGRVICPDRRHIITD